jgi:hypothetical protein
MAETADSERKTINKNSSKCLVKKYLKLCIDQNTLWQYFVIEVPCKIRAPEHYSITFKKQIHKILSS